MRIHALPQIAVLPMAPKNASPVPWLTSLYHKSWRGDYGHSGYPGNCSGELIKDLLKYFRPRRVLDPMSGSGTCADVCRELGIECISGDIHQGFDATDPASYEGLGAFDFIWAHPPYWRQKPYSTDPRDLSRTPSLMAFLDRYSLALRSWTRVLAPGGKLVVLMGDYSDAEEGFMPLTYHTKRLAFRCGLRQACTDIIRFSHGASSGRKTYKSSFIPGLHDVCMIFTK